MQSIVEGCATGEIDAEVALVASDNANAAGLQWAEQRGIATAVVRPKDYSDRIDSDQALAQVIDKHSCTHLLLAGYMRILTLDSGPAVIQAAVPIQDGDDAERLAAKVLPFEHKIYPTATQWLVSGRLELKGDVAWLDNQELKEPMQSG
eukprot:snap_masked-scaffold1_size3401120-processed-gene-24.4 protein:Tk04927 transcript:snap_masked-scaffold1_size3401120-processed-gene-24.4-mRNA-1 annotation:"phosphoribosylglycinamide formyltransferase"